jgi:predicted Zn finger-like uncharacterized protein
MKIEIKCPHCEFTAKIPEERIPPRAKYANCPKCKKRFQIKPAAPPSDLGDTAPLVYAPREEGISSMRTQYHEIRIPTPWEDRVRVGLWKGIYKTLINTVFNPLRTFKTMKHDSGIKDPLAFGLLFGSLGLMFSIFWDFALAPWGAGGSFGSAFSNISALILFPALMALSPLLVLAYLFIFAGIIHLFLMMVRGGKNGFEATFRTVAYGQATQFFGIIPFIGGFISGIWALVVEIIGLKEIHATSYIRVLFAIFLPIILIVILAVLVAVTLSVAILR